jgi:hypothetical protein
MDFAAMLSVENGIITKLELVKVNMYSAEASNPDHANDKSFNVVCRVM